MICSDVRKIRGSKYLRNTVVMVRKRLVFGIHASDKPFQTSLSEIAGLLNEILRTSNFLPKSQIIWNPFSICYRKVFNSLSKPNHARKFFEFPSIKGIALYRCYYKNATIRMLTSPSDYLRMYNSKYNEFI